MKWHTLLAEPEYAQLIRARHRQILDTLESLCPPPQPGNPHYEDYINNDRYVGMSFWLKMGQDLGLLTAREHSDLRDSIGPQM